MTTTDTANTSDASEEHSEPNETSRSDWGYLGITSFKTVAYAPNELGIGSVRAVQEHRTESSHRAVYLTEEGRVCPEEGGIPVFDEHDWHDFEKVGVVSNYIDGAEVVGTVYAMPEGDCWYWVPFDEDTRAGDVGDGDGFLPDSRRVEEPPDGQPDRGAELIGWIDPGASWSAVEDFINELGDSDVVEFVKARVEPEDYLEPDTGGD